MTTHEGDLGRIAADTHFASGRARSLGIAAAAYGQFPDAALLWVEGREFLPIDRPSIQRALSAA